MLLGRLGSGGMGVVYLGRSADGEIAAVKTVHASLAAQPEFRQRFRSEIARVRQVPPYCTAELLDADLEHDPPYLVVEYVDGPTLGEVVERGGPLRASRLHALAVGVATALAGIHGAGVVHRDLKPENVLLPPGNPKVIDFGIARAFDSATGLTAPDRTVGTLSYMAPERLDVRSTSPAGQAADIFSWGCVVAYAGTGRSPFRGDSPTATAGRILTQEPDLDALREPLRSIVAAALLKEPEHRPTARELLELLLGGEYPAPPGAEPTDIREPGVRKAGARQPAGTRDRGAHEPWSVEAGVGAGVAAGAGPTGLGKTAVQGPVVGESGVRGSRLPAASQNKRWRRVVALAAAVVVAGGAATGITLGMRKGDAAGGRVLIADALTTPGKWANSEGSQHRAGCTVQGKLTVTSTVRNAFKCTGSETIVTGDFTAAFTADLLTRGSCAAMWFGWNPGRGGEMLLICPDAISLATDAANGTKIVGSLPVARRLQPGSMAHVRLDAGDGRVAVYRDGDLAGNLTLPAGATTTGKIRLGLYVQPQGGKQPFQVAFSDLEIRAA
jgi:hypothetical protein